MKKEGDQGGSTAGQVETKVKKGKGKAEVIDVDVESEEEVFKVAHGVGQAGPSGVGQAAA